MVARGDGVAAARGHRRQPRPRLVPHPGQPSRALRDRRGGRAAPGPALRGRPPARRAVRLLRPAAPATAGRLARRRRRRSGHRSAWQPDLWRALVDRDGDRPAAHSARENRCAAAGLRDRHCRRGCRCSATPGCRSPRSSCSTRWPPTTTCTCGCRTQRRVVDRRWADLRGAIPRRDDDSHRRVEPSPAGHARPRPAGAAAQPARRPRHRRVPVGGDAGPDTLLGLAAVRHRRQCRRPAGRVAARRRPFGAGARLPRTGPPGRRAARGAARPARRRPDARAARHPGDVPGHRDLCTADRRRLRPRRRGAAARTPPTGCGCGWPTGRWSRPTRCSAVAAQLLALAGGRVTATRCSTWPRAPRCGPGSGSPTTTSRASPAGCASPASGGASTPRTAPRSASTSSTTPGVSGWTGCWPASPCPTTPTPGSTTRFRSTTSAASGSNWPAGSPSSSTGCSEVTDALTGTRPLRDWLAALADGVTPLTRVDAPTGGRSARCSASSTRFWPPPARGRPRCGCRTSRAARRQLAGRPTRANFRTGTLTVCTMVPMRSVPHRVVCLVGLDDGVFPRIGVVDGDDVLARDPMTGERDIRSEDRQLLLDAIVAATETLVITYTGANEFSGQPRPPAVPLAELLDALDATTPTAGARRVTVHHPLQPFDIRNVEPGRLVPGIPFTFDSHGAAGGPGRRRAARRTAARSSPGRCHAAARRRRRWPTWWGSSGTRSRASSARSTTPCPRRSRGRGRDAGGDRRTQEWAVGDRMLADLLRGRPRTRRVKPNGGAAPCHPESSAGARPPRSATRSPCSPPRPLKCATAAPRALDVDVDPVPGGGSPAPCHRCTATAWCR